MSDVTMDQKLQLVQQVRARYHEDQFDLSNRERILYGRSDITPVRTQSGRCLSLESVSLSRPFC